MGFYVRFDDIRSINEITVQQISKWQEELVALQGAMQKVIGLDSFQGETADSIKTYYNEIHNLLLSAIGSTMVDFMTKIMLYWDGYYSIDGDIHTKLNEDTLNKAIKEYDNSLDKLDTSQTSLKTTLDSVSDIFYSIIPAVGTLEYYHDDAKDKIISVKDKVIPYEESVLNNELANLRELIENTIAYIREYKNGDRNIMIHYSSGDYMNDENIYNLAVSMNKAQEYQQIHQKDLEEAISQQKKVYEQLQEEYEAEIEKLAKERADQGTAQVIMGVFAVGVGFAAIVLTAGAATPLVVTAAVTGTCSMAYGLSEVSEGTQHVYYGLNGDPYTSAFNPLRDTIFMGNQEVYSMWGNINMTVAGLCIPVGKSTQGLKGIEAIKAGGKAIAKEVVMDQASEFVASYTVPVISDAMNIDSTTGKTLLNLGVQMFTEGALEKGVDAAEVKIETQRIKIEAEASGKGLAGLMDEAEATRYESYWLNQEIEQIKIEADTIGKGLAGLMDEAEAARYESYWLNQEIEQIKIEADAGGKGLAGLMDEAEAARYESYWLNQDTNNIKIETETIGTGKEIYGPYYEEALALHEENPDFFPDPDGSTIVQGEELEMMRDQYDSMAASGELERGHHVQGLAFGGDNVQSNIVHTGESTIRRDSLTLEQQQQYIDQGFTKNSEYKVAKIVEDPNGSIIKNGKKYSFGLNKTHTEATNFQNKVIKWQREAGLRD